MVTVMFVLSGLVFLAFFTLHIFNTKVVGDVLGPAMYPAYCSVFIKRVCILKILLFVCFFFKSGLLFLPCFWFLVNNTHVCVCRWPIIFLYFLLKPTQIVTVLFDTRNALQSKATNVNFCHREENETVVELNANYIFKTCILYMNIL